MGTWSDWEDLGGTIISAPSAASRVRERITVVARGTKNQIVYRSYTDGSGWTDWSDLGGHLTYDPAVISSGPKQYTVYAVGGQQSGGQQVVWRKVYTDGSGWSDWWKTNESTPGWAGVAAASAREGRIDMFTLNEDNQVLHATCPAGGSWQPFKNIGGTMQGTVAAASWGTGRVDLVTRGAATNNLWHRVCNGSTWTKWREIGSDFVSGPAVASWGPDRLDVFGKGHDHQVLHRSWNGQTWSEWNDLGIQNTDDNLAAVSRVPGNIELFARGRDNHLWHRTYTADASELDNGGVDDAN
ncbi:hypothetical protein ABZ061_28690 [Streptomyces mutabilis]|uniref:hypothetical protein n=1 Tax=Streptomyces mutabilis TaxID=67332 RepID=UPI0033BDBC89